ncbi:T9SS type A sorting domain-containing protein, partial [Candidatus Poribacteria bacterium]|nr:T9SS type A sorting domain-containing protein [Candidatus Poribacteria bacterium]
AGTTDAKYDVTGDGKVDINDIVAVTTNRSGGAAGAPTLLGRKFSALERDALQEQIDLLIATNDRSPAAMRTLVYLQQLIAMARPEKTQLLANYPNPFNPETWMPYELATDTNVRITIYNAQGVVIRTLQLGQQSAGYYTDRERAAYWDGRNALGERVASGIYFYQLQTDTMSALRKMVILK